MVNLTKEEFEVISEAINEDLENYSLDPYYDKHRVLLASAHLKLKAIFEAGPLIDAAEDLLKACEIAEPVFCGEFPAHPDTSRIIAALFKAKKI